MRPIVFNMMMVAFYRDGMIARPKKFKVKVNSLFSGVCGQNMSITETASPLRVAGFWLGLVADLLLLSIQTASSSMALQWHYNGTTRSRASENLLPPYMYL
jgi:hypothetical protein